MLTTFDRKCFVLEFVVNIKGDWIIWSQFMRKKKKKEIVDLPLGKTSSLWIHFFPSKMWPSGVGRL